jgi:uncharacterized membrane protein
MLTLKRKNIANWLLVALLGYFCVLMLRITLQYIPVQTDVAFLQIKQTYIDNDLWFGCFYIHVYTSMFALVAGFTQFWPQLLKRFKKLHRRVGYVYIITVVFISGPASIVMGWYANGGVSSRVAFLLLSFLWIFFTAKAWQKAMQKKIIAHRKYMIRSYALTLSAISLRAWKVLIIYSFHPGPVDAYRIVAWLGWVGNLLLAEYIIRSTFLCRKEGSAKFKATQS